MIGFGFFSNQFKGLFYYLKMPEVSGLMASSFLGGIFSPLDYCSKFLTVLVFLIMLFRPEIKVLSVASKVPLQCCGSALPEIPSVLAKANHLQFPGYTTKSSLPPAPRPLLLSLVPGTFPHPHIFFK